MPWAARRRFFILLILAAFAVAFAVVLFFAVVYDAPSCADTIQNQGEAGVDCGGSCAFLCTEEVQPPTVLFTKALQNSNGRTDVVASVENKNPGAAARNVPYTVTLYGAGQALIQQATGVLDLPPSANVPVYLPGILSGKQTVTSAFLTIDTSAPRWFTLRADPRILPTVSNITLGGTIVAPRIQALLTNPTVSALTNVRVVAIVHEIDGNIIAASQTIVPVVPAQGEATATFTWSSAFLSAPANIEVVPVIPLPDRQAGLP